MKKLVPLALVALLLSGCPNSKIPKPPSKVPEPKLTATMRHTAPASLPFDGVFHVKAHSQA